MSHMSHFYVLLLALGIGVIAGLRSMTAPAVISWAAALHWINLNGTWASWVGNWITVGIFTALALGPIELASCCPALSTPDAEPASGSVTDARMMSNIGATSRPVPKPMIAPGSDPASSPTDMTTSGDRSALTPKIEICEITVSWITTVRTVSRTSRTMSRVEGTVTEPGPARSRHVAG